MIKFAKVFDLKNQEQLLICKAFDDDQYSITASIQLDNIDLKATFGCSDEEKRDRDFDKYDIVSAEKTYKALMKEFIN
jgi:hypothetical protein